MNKNADLGVNVMKIIPEENEAECGDMKVFLLPLWSGCWWFVAGSRGEPGQGSVRPRPQSLPQAEESLPPHHLRGRQTV